MDSTNKAKFVAESAAATARYIALRSTQEPPFTEVSQLFRIGLQPKISSRMYARLYAAMIAIASRFSNFSNRELDMWRKNTSSDDLAEARTAM